MESNELKESIKNSVASIFLDFNWHAIEKLDIMNLSGYSCEVYAYKVLSDSEVTFFEERKDSIFFQLIYCLFYGQRCIFTEVSR